MAESSVQVEHLSSMAFAAHAVERKFQEDGAWPLLLCLPFVLLLLVLRYT